MKTYKAIDIIKNSILEDSIADAIFLKGSIGRDEDDKYSDVDMYVLSFNELSYYYTEIYAAYKRDNLLWANRLLSHALGNITILIRSLYDKKYPYLGFKKINKIIPHYLYEKLLYASDHNNSQSLKETYLSIIDLQNYYMEHCSENIRNFLNLRFFKYVEKQVKNNF